jgi:hypothetical protein
MAGRDPAIHVLWRMQLAENAGLLAGQRCGVKEYIHSAFHVTEVWSAGSTIPKDTDPCAPREAQGSARKRKEAQGRE